MCDGGTRSLRDYYEVNCTTAGRLEGLNSGPSQSVIDVANSAFWNELCGSAAARSLGITGNDPVSSKKFDDWYFSSIHTSKVSLTFPSLHNRDVLEVGLGYWTVGQRVAESAARYTGLDIAQGPADGFNHRLAQCGLPGRAVQGSILNPPFNAESFDAVIAIGCYHHTGNLPLALANTAKLLRPAWTSGHHDLFSSQLRANDCRSGWNNNASAPRRY